MGVKKWFNGWGLIGWLLSGYDVCSRILGAKKYGDKIVLVVGWGVDKIVLVVGGVVLVVGWCCIRLEFFWF